MTREEGAKVKNRKKVLKSQKAAFEILGRMGGV
jgi:hypothetical protein